MKLRFWGVRGSIPVAGADTVKYGGNTSCLEITEGSSTFILDCGTGVRGLGNELLSRKVDDLQIFFTHLHMDHTFGVGFFAPIFAPSQKIQIHVPSFGTEEAEAQLGKLLNGLHSPLRIRDIPAQLTFHKMSADQEYEGDRFHIRSVLLNHPGGALGYRISNGKSTLVHLTDTSPLAKVGEGVKFGKAPPTIERKVLEALEGADCMVMDTMFSWEQYLERMTWGHSYPEYALALAKEAGVKKLILFHHLPSATDADLDQLAAAWQDHSDPEVVLAREGMIVDFEG